MDNKALTGLLNLFNDKSYIHTSKSKNYISFSVYYTKSPHIYLNQYKRKKILYTCHVYFHRDGSYEFMDTIQGDTVNFFDKAKRKVEKDIPIEGYIAELNGDEVKSIKWNNKGLKREIEKYMQSIGKKQKSQNDWKRLSLFGSRRASNPA